MSTSAAALGGIRERLGMDEGKRRYSRIAVQPGVPSLQRMEAAGRARGVLRTHESRAPNDDSDDRTQVGGRIGSFGKIIFDVRLRRIGMYFEE
jgi:hypothetical protein